MHVNAQLRQIVKDRLFGAVGLNRIDTSRGNPIEDDELPAAIITTPRDTVERATKPAVGVPARERRQIELEITVIAKGDTVDLDDHLDELRAEIEAKLLGDGDQTLGGFAKEVFHTGAELDLGSDEQGQRWYAFLMLRYLVEIWTAEGNPEAAT